MTGRTTPFDHATRMTEPAPTPTIVQDADERVSTRDQIREERAARALHLRDRRTVFIVVPVIMLLIVGLGAMLSASSVVAIRETGDHLFYIKRQIIWVGLGLASLVIFSKVPYRWYRTFALPIFLVAVIGLLATLVVGDVRGGARRWIEVGPLTIQASEFAKIATIILLSAVLAKKERLLDRFPHFILPVVTILGVVSGLLLLQPDFGTALLIGVSAFAVLLASLGGSRARWSFLPNAHTDFIFAIIGEETGFIGAMLVIVLFAVFAAVGIRIALTAPDTFGRLLAVGIVSWLTFQALVNIGGVVAVLPITGVPLPFVSSGGNAMIVSLGAVGMLINISRSSGVEPESQ